MLYNDNPQLEVVSNEYLELCKRHSLNPSILSDVMMYRAKGLNNTGISEMLMLHRVTVQKYLDAVREMEGKEFVKLLVGCLLFAGAITMISAILNEK